MDDEFENLTNDDDNEEDFDEIDLEPASETEALEVVEVTLDHFLDTADVSRSFGNPVQHGDTIIIPCAEVLTGLGFGTGYGSSNGEQGGISGGGGGGGGGRTFSRPVAVIVASPEGVRVEPVVDVTKIAMAMFTAVGFSVAMTMRMARWRRFRRYMKT